MHPVDLQKNDNRELVISWNDGVQATIPFRVLRERCQCAGCNEKRLNPPEPVEMGSLPILSTAEARPLEIEKMHPVGNYAYSIHFTDGHSAGIYTFEMLRNIGQSLKQT